jgi:hypothetical protein
MSVEIATASGPIGQFASNSGFIDLASAASHVPVLKSFFELGYTECVPPIVSALRVLSGTKDVTDTAKALADLMEGQELVIITDGTSDGVVE